MRTTMISRALFGAVALSLAALGPIFLTDVATAQQPSSAQIAAVRSSCPADYRAHCASVPPGGQASLACLVKNMGSLSAACRNAVAAASGTSAGQAPAAARPAASPDASAPAAPAASAPAPAPAQAAAPPPAPGAPALPPREELALLRIGCGADFRLLCRGTPPGGGRILSCLSTHRASLSPQCVRALVQLRQQ
jgi:hypothetical protein